jgi:hypothetical protein
MSDKISKLIKIADFLDRHNKEDEASFIDDLMAQIKKAEYMEELEVEIPEDELEMLKLVYDSLGKSLE